MPPPLYCGKERISWGAQFALSQDRCFVGEVSDESTEVPGLSAKLDKLCHHYGGISLPSDKPHAFVYFITITNASDRTITLLGRKWVVQNCDGSRLIVEGDRIVGETPRLAPGERFSYNSYHAIGMDAVAYGCFHGVDEKGHRIHIRLNPIPLCIPRGIL